MKYNYEIRLKGVKLVLEGGLSVREAGCHLGCGRSQVHLWVTLFERHGLAGLKLRHGSYSAEFKLSVLKHMHQNHLSLLETAVHFGIPGPFVIRQWERLYQNQGAEGLRRKPQRRRPAMSKSKTKKVKLKTTPHEELLKELAGKSPSHRRTKAAVPAFSIAQSRRDGAKHILLSLQKIKTTR